MVHLEGYLSFIDRPEEGERVGVPWCKDDPYDTRAVVTSSTHDWIKGMFRPVVELDDFQVVRPNSDSEEVTEKKHLANLLRYLTDEVVPYLITLGFRVIEFPELQPFSLPKIEVGKD